MPASELPRPSEDEAGGRVTNIELSHMIGLALFACTLPFVHRLSLLEREAAATATLLVAAAWESIVLPRGRLPEHRHDRGVA